MQLVSSLLPVSAVVLTFNSDRTLREVLHSLRFCREIVIVDSGSTDRTLAIAEYFNCTILKRKLVGFGEQKDFGVKNAKYDWIFVVDSDEIVSPALHSEILKLFHVKPMTSVAYSVPIQLYFLGHPIYHSGQRSKKSIRLFDRRHAHFDQALVHETVMVKTGESIPLKGPLHHYSYLCLEDYFTKLNRYTTLGAEDMAKRSLPTKRYKVVTSFPFQFLKFYILKFGFLDGYYGFLWCMLSAFYPVVKYAKHEDLCFPTSSIMAFSETVKSTL